MTLQGIYDKTHISTSSSSQYMNAQAVPAENTLATLHKLARTCQQDPEHPALQIPLEQLQLLRSKAAQRHCACCDESRDAAAAAEVALVAAGTREQRPASRKVRSTFQRNALHRITHNQEATNPAPEIVAPVPTQRGDRHDVYSAPPTWTALEELAQRLQQGRGDDARVILEYAGRREPVTVIPGIVASCRGSGLHESADTVLHHAGQRDKEAVIVLASLLNAQGSHEDTNALLRAAIGTPP